MVNIVRFSTEFFFPLLVGSRGYLTPGSLWNIWLQVEFRRTRGDFSDEQPDSGPDEVHHARP